MYRWLVLVLALSLVAADTRDGLGGVVVTLMSQSDSFHSSKAVDKGELWRQQMRAVGAEEPTVLLAHELGIPGSWTIVPLLPHLSSHYRSAHWFFFVGEETEIDFSKLDALLAKYDHEKDYFLGQGLKDVDRTILHHYIMLEDFLYPHLPSGWLLSTPALHKAALHHDEFNLNFNIDASYEFAMFLMYLRSYHLSEFVSSPPPAHTDGTLLTHVPELCLESHLQPSCVTASQHTIPHCGEVETDNVFFAVKTYGKNHNSRLPVVMATWGEEVRGSMAYYSDVEDPSFSTTDIGVPNVVRGHCGKTLAIMETFLLRQDLEDKQWLVIADDDTLLGVQRLRRLLLCYDHTHPILLGEAYGYNAHRDYGTTYITGGGGMVLSREFVRRVVEGGHKCPSLDYFDDMFLGSLVETVGGDLVHSPLFHQDQPSSYPSAVLHLQTAVSFHRHKPDDPVTIYRNYLTDPHQLPPADTSPRQKTEL